MGQPGRTLLLGGLAILAPQAAARSAATDTGAKLTPEKLYQKLELLDRQRR
jgi:hypothetical protein